MLKRTITIPIVQIENQSLERLSNLSTVTQLMHIEARIKTQPSLSPEPGHNCSVRLFNWGLSTPSGTI